MKTYPLIVVATVAFLSTACGTSSPTGPDVAANATASALRAEPGTPPQAPLPPSSEQVPMPSPKPDPSPKPVPTPEPTSPETVPVPADRGGNRPAPPPVPSADTHPGSDPTLPRPGSGVVPPPAGPVPTPAPPTDPGPVPAPDVCLALSVEITSTTIFAPSSGVALEAILLDKYGIAITDNSCEKVLWQAEGSPAGSHLVITYGANSRLVTITGVMAGTYKIGAITPNGVTATLVIDVK